jgi:hypothetical protein
MVRGEQRILISAELSHGIWESSALSAEWQGDRDELKATFSTGAQDMEKMSTFCEL